MTPQILTIILAVAGIAFSIFFGCKACAIFVDQKSEEASSERTSSFKFYQFWFNFLGSMFGWAALWILLDSHDWLLATSHRELQLSDGVLFFTAFVGMTGHLPMTMMGVVLTLGEVVKKLLGLATKENH